MLEVGLGAYPTRRFAPYPTFAALGFVGADPPVNYIGDLLRPGRALRPGMGLKSKNGRVKVNFQTDGNLVLYGDGNPLWWTGNDPSIDYAIMQTDGNFVLYRNFGKLGQTAMWSTGTAGRANAYLVAQDEGNLVMYWGSGGSALWSSETEGFKYYGGPGQTTVFEDVLSVAGDVIAVAQVVVSFVPGIGAGINAAIAAGAALAKGENITDALAEATKNALPGGPIAAAAFDAAVAAGKAIASGQSIGDAALAATRAALPSEEAKRAFDVGLAVVHGQNVQQALVAVTVSLAPEAAKAATAMFKQPELLKLPVADIAKALNTSVATVNAAAAALHSSKPLVAAIGEPRRPPPQLREAKVRPPTLTEAKMKPPQLKAAAPKAPPPVVVAAGVKPTPAVPPGLVPGAVRPRGTYAPYPPSGALSAPPMHHPAPHAGHGGHGGHGGHFRQAALRGGRGGPGWWWGVPWSPEVVTTTETCRTWSDPIAMPPDMANAARNALGASGGRPTTVRGPDNVLYLFAVESGKTTARACAAVAVA
jgi:hypothetical protein